MTDKVFITKILSKYYPVLQIVLFLKYCDLQDNQNHQTTQGLIYEWESKLFPLFTVKSRSGIETYSMNVADSTA